MNAMKRALLAGTILPGLLAAPAFAQVLAPDGSMLMAQAQPQPQDPRRPPARPGAPPPQQQGRPSVAPVQQPRPAVTQPARPAAPPIQQVRPPVQPAAPQAPRPSSPAMVPSQPRPPAAAAPRAPVAPPPAAQTAPQRPAAQPPAAIGGRPTPPPAGFAQPRPDTRGQGAPPPAVQRLISPGGQPPTAVQRPIAPGAQPPTSVQRPIAPGAQPPAVPPSAGTGQPPRPGTPGAIRPADGRPPFGGTPPGQTPPPAVVQPATPPPGVAPGGAAGQPGTPPGAAASPNAPRAPIGQRTPGAPLVQPGTAQPPGSPQQPPAFGQRGPGGPGTPPGTAQPPGSPQQPPAFGQRGPGAPGTPPGTAQPPGSPQQPPAFGQRGPGGPGTPPGTAQPPGSPQQPPAFGQRGPGGPGGPGQPPGVAPGAPGFAGGQPPSGPPERRRGSRIGPAGAAAIGVGAGLIGGFMLNQGARAEQRVDQVRERRREFSQDGVTVIHEPGRTIVRDGEGVFIRHDETARFRELGGDFRTERRGNELVSFYDRPGGVRVITITDENGQLLRRIRRYPDGREVVLIDNSFRPRARTFEEQIVVLPPPEVAIPRERYIVDAEDAPPEMIYEALTAPPVQRPPRRYTLDEVRYSPTVRAYTRSVDVNTINFDAGSWEVKPDQVGRLDTIAAALGRAITANPNEVFLIEGHTDATGTDVDNLSLSDRRAQSVAAILTQNYNIPPENLTTQGYGEQYLKVQTQGPSRENRRVTLRRVTELLNQQNTQAPQQ